MTFSLSSLCSKIDTGLTTIESYVSEQPLWVTKASLVVSSIAAAKLFTLLATIPYGRLGYFCVTVCTYSFQEMTFAKEHDQKQNEINTMNKTARRAFWVKTSLVVGATGAIFFRSLPSLFSAIKACSFRDSNIALLKLFSSFFVGAIAWETMLGREVV